MSQIVDLQKWADIVIQRWRARIVDMEVVNTWELYRSFVAQVEYDSEGDPQKAIFTYLYYGLFPQLGVGNNVPMEAVDGSNRQRKPWRNAILKREVARLGTLMAQQYGQNIADQMKTILESSDVRKNDEAWYSSSYNPKNQ